MTNETSIHFKKANKSNKTSTMRKLIIICLACTMGTVLQAQDAEAIIKDYELQLWKEAMQYVFDELDMNLIYKSEEIKEINDILKVVNDCECEKGDELCETAKDYFNDHKRVQVFSQVEKVFGPLKTLQGTYNIWSAYIKEGDYFKSLKDIFLSAQNDVRLLCLWGDKNCLQRIKEVIKKGDDLGYIYEVQNLSNLKGDDDEAVQKLQSLAREKEAFLEKKNLKTWQKINKGVKEYQDKFKDEKFKPASIGVEFPHKCSDCIKEYTRYITENPAEEKLCLSQIKKSQKLFFEKLKKTKKSYAKYVKDVKQGETQFKKELAAFAASFDDTKKSHFKFSEYKINRGSRLQELWKKLSEIPLLYIVLLGLSFLVVLGLYGYKTFNRESPVKPKVIDEDEHLEVLNAREKKINELKELLDEEKEKVKKLNQEINRLTKELEVEKNKSKRETRETTTTTNQSSQSNGGIPITNKEHNFFALRPDGDNGFLIQNLSKNIEDQLYYVIAEQSNGTAEFWLTEDNDLQKSAARSSNTILNDACEYENLPRETKTGIHTTANGKLKKSANLKEWEIVSKAKIKFV